MQLIRVFYAAASLRRRNVLNDSVKTLSIFYIRKFQD